MLMALSVSSQELTPKVFVDNGDTLIAFTVPQAKLLGKGVIRKQQCDSLLVLSGEKEKALLDRIRVKDDQIKNLEARVGNKDLMIMTQKKIVSNKDEQIEVKDKKIKGLKIKKAAAKLGMVVLAVLSFR